MPETVEQKCGNCKWFVPPLHPNGKPDMRHDAYGKCGFQVTWPIMPASYDRGIPMRCSMLRHSGRECRCWESKVKPRNSEADE